jgi:L-fuconolactonase
VNAQNLQTFVDHALDVFSPERVMFGGDWPVSTLTGSYPDTWATANELVAGLSESERASVFGGASTVAYRLG